MVENYGYVLDVKKFNLDKLVETSKRNDNFESLRKLSKIEGVKSVNVNFDKETAVVLYQPQIITPKEIDEIVNNIAGGLYKVVIK